MIEEEEIIEDGVTEIISTLGGQQYVQTPTGLIKVEAGDEHFDHIIYRLANSIIACAH